MFHHKLLTREGRVFGQRMNSSIIHDNICSLVHKCNLESYHSDIKYHMTLNIIFSVACSKAEALELEISHGLETSHSPCHSGHFLSNCCVMKSSHFYYSKYVN